MKKTLNNIVILVTFALGFGVGRSPDVVSAAVYHVGQGKNASDANPGTSQLPFKTISRAAALTLPGDTVIVHGGIYRECVRPTKGGTGPDKMITYQAAPGETVVIKGSKMFDPVWQPANPKTPLPNFVQADLPDSFFEVGPRLFDKAGKPGLYHPFRIPLRTDLETWPEIRYKPRTAEDGPCLVIGEAYIRGKPLRQVVALDECRVYPGTYFVPADAKKLYVHFMQFTKGAVELTVREQCFAPEFRGLGYLCVRGFTMEQCANQGPFPQVGVLSTRSGHHWIVENNIIRFGATIGIDCGSEIACWYKYRSKAHIEEEGKWAPGSTPAVYEQAFMEKGWQAGEQVNHIDRPAPAVGHVIRNNVVSDNGLCGIMALKAENLVIEGNIIERNNRRLLYAGVENYAVNTCETGGIKLHLTKNSLIRNNLVRDEHGWSPGIWLDNNNDNARITGNLVLGCWFGVDLEINTEPILVDNNIIAFSRVDGLSSRESTKVRFVHNTVLYSGRWGCIFTYGGTRDGYFHRKFQPARQCAVINNVFAGSLEKDALRLPLPTKDANDNIVSGNLIRNDQPIFQLENMRQDKSFPFDEYIATAKFWLTEKKLPPNLWPDFKTWKADDPWNRGLCSFEVFNAVLGSPDNHFQDFTIPVIFGRVDQFANPTAHAWPIRESLYPDIPPGYTINQDSSAWPKVKPYEKIDRDYLANTIDSSSVLPGALQTGNKIQFLTLWPKKEKP